MRGLAGFKYNAGPSLEVMWAVQFFNISNFIRLVTPPWSAEGKVLTATGLEPTTT